MTQQLLIGTDASSKLRAEILDTLRKRGPMTSFELARHLERGIESVAPRVSELHTADKVWPVEGVFRAGPAGGMAQVWKVMEGPAPKRPQQIDLL